MFAIDANEPRHETLDSVTFHWRDGRPGARKLAALLGLPPHSRPRPAPRAAPTRALHAAGVDYLALTYTTHGGGDHGRRRFDSMWATPEFALHHLATEYEKALAAGTDHAMLAADLELGPPDRD